MKQINIEKFIIIFGFIVELCVIVLIFCFLFSSCKSTKTKTETKSDVSEHKNIELTVANDSKSAALKTDDIKKTLSMQANTIEYMLFTLYSAPDSSGRQYPVAAGKVSKRTNVNREENSNIKSDAEIISAEKTEISLKDKSESDSKSETKETKEENKKVPAWIGLAGLIVIAGIIIYIIGFLGRK